MKGGVMAEVAKEEVFKKGLEGVVAGDSSICSVQGDVGKLYYRGYSIGDLAANCSFEEVTYLLLYTRLPTKQELKAFRKTLVGQMKLPKHVLAVLKKLPKETTPMEALRTGISALSVKEPEALGRPVEEQLPICVNLIAKFPAVVAAYHRIRNGQKPVSPKKSMGYAANFLYLLNGRAPTPEEESVVDADFVLHAEHSFNASTFAVRVTVSTLSDMYSAMTTGIGVLKGPLHGGAAQEVMVMLEKIDNPDKVDSFVRDALVKHEKIMGIGHRIYKVYDPRAKIIKARVEALSRQKGDTRWYTMLVKIEEIMAREKHLYPNVDFYSAVVYKLLGLPIDMYSPMFAIARSAGWSAHAVEQYSDNRLIRPVDHYVGPIDLQFVPINERH